MRAGVKVGYRSGKGDVSFNKVAPFMEYVSFQRECAKNMQDTSVSDDVTEVVFVMKKADVNKLITDLRIDGLSSDETEFKEKANMGDDTNIIWRGVYIALDDCQLKIYYG